MDSSFVEVIHDPLFGLDNCNADIFLPLLASSLDGQWQHHIVDDQLYLRAADYGESMDERQVWEDINRTNPEEEYRKAFQTGSRALYFAQCNDKNETWLPLLEKAYAKAHGDYSAIEGGLVG